MSKAEARTRMRDAISQSGGDWIFAFWGVDADKNLERIAADLERFAREYQRRFGERPDPWELLRLNPAKGAAFFQVDSLLVSLEMKIMIWRILLGCEIARVDFKYDGGKKPVFQVILKPPYGQGEERYTGQRADDFRVLKHFGITAVDESLFLQGYYAVRGVV